MFCLIEKLPFAGEPKSFSGALLVQALMWLSNRSTHLERQGRVEPSFGPVLLLSGHLLQNSDRGSKHAEEIH